MVKVVEESNCPTRLKIGEALISELRNKISFHQSSNHYEVHMSYKLHTPVAATFDPSGTLLVPNTGVRTNVVSNASESA